MNSDTRNELISELSIPVHSVLPKASQASLESHNKAVVKLSHDWSVIDGKHATEGSALIRPGTQAAEFRRFRDALFDSTSQALADESELTETAFVLLDKCSKELNAELVKSIESLSSVEEVQYGKVAKMNDYQSDEVPVELVDRFKAQGRQTQPYRQAAEAVDSLRQMIQANTDKIGRLSRLSELRRPQVQKFMSEHLVHA